MLFWMRKYLYIERGHQAEEYGGEVFLVSSVKILAVCLYAVRKHCT